MNATTEKKIRTVKPNEIDKGTLKAMSAKLAMANTMLGQGKKMADQAKESIARWLKENREIDLNVLEIGEMVQIEDILLLEIGKQSRFDEIGFAQSHPDLHEDFRKDFPIKKFKSLV